MTSKRGQLCSLGPSITSVGGKEWRLTTTVLNSCSAPLKTRVNGFHVAPVKDVELSTLCGRVRVVHEN